MKSSITLEQAKNRRKQFEDLNDSPFDTLPCASKLIPQIKESQRRQSAPEEITVETASPKELAPV